MISRPGFPHLAYKVGSNLESWLALLPARGSRLGLLSLAQELEGLPWRNSSLVLQLTGSVDNSVDGEGTTKEVELQKWARPLFADLRIVSGDHKCPQGSAYNRTVS
jgi:hypothetical protein